jgi:UDP-N-acetylglucosamine--N-acetylmuramyl-(pentapeptide) pyrophosphoryl-undecaprenol N-acetylglucosamine transferase
VWLTGVGKAVPVQNAHVRVVEYLEKEYGDVLAAADLVVSRAGAGALAELARDAKAAVLIPLPTAGSRGDQLKNAEILAAQGAVVVLAQETTNSQNLAKSVLKLLQDKKLRHKMGKTLGGYAKPKAAETLAKVILKAGSCAK